MLAWLFELLPHWFVDIMPDWVAGHPLLRWWAIAMIIGLPLGIIAMIIQKVRGKE